MKRWIRDERGESAASVIIGAVVGLMVVGGLATFWVVANKAAESGHVFSSQESAATQVLNRVGRDVSDSRSVLYAAKDELVVEKNATEGGGAQSAHPYQWVRYVLEDDDEGVLTMFQYTWNEPVGANDKRLNGAKFDADAHKFDGALAADQGVARQRVATDAASRDVFSYVGVDSNQLTNLPRKNQAESADIRRVLINFKANTDNGTVEIQTQAAVRPGWDGEAHVAPPACAVIQTPIENNHDDKPVLRWTGVAGATEYLVHANGRLVGGLAHDGTGAYVFTDPDPVIDKGSQLYLVTAVGPGGEATDCTSEVWDPKLDEPLVWGLVYPKANPAQSIWNDYMPVGSITPVELQLYSAAFDKPRAVMQWEKIKGASDYEVWGRRVDVPGTPFPFQRIKGAQLVENLPNGGCVQPLVNEATENGVPCASVEMDYGQEWEFHVVASNGLRSSEASNSFTVMTPPAVPELFGQAADYGINAFTMVRADSTTDKYFALRGTVVAGMIPMPDSVVFERASDRAETFADDLSGGEQTLSPSPAFEGAVEPKPYLGIRSQYWGYAHNKGVRGYTKSGDTVVAMEPISAYSMTPDEPTWITQFPNPVTTQAEGSDWTGNGTPDHVGINTVAPVLPNVSGALPVGSHRVNPSYKLYGEQPTLSNGQLTVGDTRVNLPASTNNCPPGMTKPCYQLPAPGAGTNTAYMFVAETDCGHPGGCAQPGVPLPRTNERYVDSAKAYQRPAQADALAGGNANADNCMASDGRSVSTVATSNTNGVYHCATNQAGFTYTAEADKGLPADMKYCTVESDLCTARLSRPGLTVPGLEYGTGRTEDELSGSNWGVTDTWGVAACNPGGCGPARTTTVRAYPGPFQLNSSSHAQIKHIRHFCEGTHDPNDCKNRNGDGGITYNQNATMTAQWQASPGAASYAYRTRRTGGPRGEAGWSSWTSVGGTARKSAAVEVVPASNYTWQVRSVASNKLERYASFADGAGNTYVNITDYSAPPHVAFHEEAPMCNATQDPSKNAAYRYAVRWARDTYAASGVSANNYASGVRVFWYVGKNGPAGSVSEIWDAYASRYWLKGTKLDNWPPNPAPNGNTRQYENYANYTEALDGKIKGVLTKQLNGNGGFGAMRTQVYTTAGKAGNPMLQGGLNSTPTTTVDAGSVRKQTHTKDCKSIYANVSPNSGWTTSSNWRVMGLLESGSRLYGSWSSRMVSSYDNSTGNAARKTAPWKSAGKWARITNDVTITGP